MNILYLCDEYPPCQHGGIGSVTRNLARELVSKGHKVSVCGFYPYYRTALPVEDDFGVKICRHFYGNRLLLKLSRNKYFGRLVNIEGKFNAYTKFLNEFIRKNRIDIIEIPDFNEVFRYTGPRFIKYPNFGIPTIIKLHGTFSFFDHLKKEYSFNNNIYRKENYLIQSADLVLSVSEFTRRIVKEIFSYPKDVTIIYNGIAITGTGAYKEDTDSKTVVFAGTLAEKKGVLSLIKAWESVILEIPTARLLIYGKGDKGTADKIKRLISDKTIGSIDLNGYINRGKLIRIYRSASCAVFPSYAESFSMAPLESMLVGCPTIFTKRASGNELIKNGENGLFVDPDDINEIANAIKYMLINRSAAIEMGRKGAQTIKERFNISGIAEDHIKVYNTLLKRRQIN